MKNMKKIYQYILLAVALVATASCSNELDDTLQPVESGTLQFVVGDFPVFGEGAQTRAIGTQDAGKTEWVDGDQIIVTLTSQQYGEQAVALTYNGSLWSTEASLSYLENETPTVSAVYAPGCKISENNIVLNDNQMYGMSEYIHAVTQIDGNTLRISFEGVKRNYSRLRIVAEAEQALTVTTTGFTPAGPENISMPDSYTLVADGKDNAYLYGTFAEGGSVTVKKGDAELANYTFTITSEQGKSYALYAGPSFSVSADKKVLFSSGNLQYTQSTQTWSFAENQWDYIGKANFNAEGDALADKIDLFCWSTNNAANNFGLSTSEEDSDYTGNFVDWGVNQIGGDAPNTWRTLSTDEWLYLFRGRKNAESLFALSMVNDVPGLIILPDNWVTPSGLTFVATTTEEGWEWDETWSQYWTYNGSEFLHNSYTAEQWEQMEAAGAVFLPVTGQRWGFDMAYWDDSGYYWSSTNKNDTYSYYMCFYSSNICLKTDEYGNYYTGFAVRLVKDL